MSSYKDAQDKFFEDLELMERDYIYPEVGDRTSPKEWVEQGSTDIRQRARAKVREILAGNYPSHIDQALDARIRQRFDVKLPAELMRPGNERW